MIKRKGARSTKDIPPDILEQLNKGEIETANLVEWLAVDQKSLLENLLIQYDRIDYLNPIIEEIHQLKKQTVNTINEAIGTTIFKLTTQNNDKEFIKIISTHQADLIRCWATYTIGKNENLSIDKTFEFLQPFAADKHFGVREISWMVTRKKIIHHLEESIYILKNWATHEDENIRRFASEATRPRGVWCEHIQELKAHPEKALSILEALKTDSSRYVQDSVGNWLNDASKSQPEFVKNLCIRWENESNTKETKYIIKKALRTLCK